MQKTANQIKSEFELLASGHYQIHSFLYAQEFEQQAYENLIYPLMLVYPLGGSLSGTSYTRNYRVVIADRVLKSEGNELEVESDTQLIALDVLAYWMKLGTNERFSITSSNTITPFWEKWGDEVTGHFVDIGIEEFYDFNSCAIPLSSAIPSPTNPCKDARILINSVVYGNAPSDTNFNVVVKDQLGALVGSLIGGEWIVNTGGACADATYTIEDSLGNVLYTGTIPSGGSATEVIGNSTLNVNKSDGTLISSRSILAEGTDSYNVGDSSAVLKDEDGNVLSTTPIKATETTNITAPNGDVSVNSVAFDDVLSGGTLNIEVRKSTGNDLIGSKQGQYWRIGDSTAVIKDSANNTLKSEAIMATETENIVVNDSVAVIKNSVGTTLKSENILSEATENITINDSSVENSDATYSVDVLAEGSLILPDSQINVNSVDSGDVVSVKTIDVNLEDSLGAPVVPTSVGLVGNTLTIEVPSGGGSYDIDTTDRFGNVLPTIIVSANATLDWNSYDFADLYLSRLLNPPTGAELTAVYTFFDDMITAGVFQKSNCIGLIIGGSNVDHSWNARYPFDKRNSGILQYIGSPTHSSTGIETNGTTSAAYVSMGTTLMDFRDKQISCYVRVANDGALSTSVSFGAGTGNSGIKMCPRAFGSTPQYFAEGGAIGSPTNKDGFISLKNLSGTGQAYHNGVSIGTNSSASVDMICPIGFGAQILAAGTIDRPCPINFSYYYFGSALTDTQELDHYNIVQALQVALSRNI
jgi:hypothetical protein